MSGATIGLALIACTSSPDDPPADATNPPADAAAPCVPTAYPVGPYGIAKGDVLEARTFDGLREDGTSGTIRIADALAPSGVTPPTPTCGDARVLVVRVHTGFCGTCRASAAQAHVLVERGLEAQTRVIDVLVRNEDDDPPTIDTATKWQAAQGLHTAVAIDPTLSWVTSDAVLPRVLVVDPRTMRIRDTLSDPAPEALTDAVAATVADIRGEATPSPRPIARIDGRFTSVQWSMIQQMVLTAAPPADPTNHVADRPGAAALGQKVFDDRLFSPSGETSCERCHEAHRAFTDGSETATGGAGGATRNTPTVVLAAWSRWQLWDGRADTLWMQALLPIEDAKEFASSRLFVAHRIWDVYREPYEAIFGPLPPLNDVVRFPPSGKPGDPQWAAMSAEDRDAVTQVFVNVGKSIAAFERTFRVSPNLLDRYALGAADALTAEQKDGLRTFFEVGCAQCHWGPRLTDDAFHVMRFPSGHEDFTPDNGRIEAAAKYDANEFRADGKWSDAKQPRRPLASDARLLGSFKTPALRGVAVTAPYGHGGSVPSLAMAIDLHRTRGMPEGNRLTTGTVDPWVVPFDSTRSGPLLALLQILAFAR